MGECPLSHLRFNLSFFVLSVCERDKCDGTACVSPLAEAIFFFQSVFYTESMTMTLQAKDLMIPKSRSKANMKPNDNWRFSKQEKVEKVGKDEMKYVRAILASYVSLFLCVCVFKIKLCIEPLSGNIRQLQ